jgi:hypothetical protein
MVFQSMIGLPSTAEIQSEVRPLLHESGNSMAFHLFAFLFPHYFVKRVPWDVFAG